MTAEILSFETGRPAELAEGEPALVVDVEGYEGPLDLLLASSSRPRERSGWSLLPITSSWRPGSPS